MLEDYQGLKILKREVDSDLMDSPLATCLIANIFFCKNRVRVTKQTTKTHSENDFRVDSEKSPIRNRAVRKDSF